MRVAKGRWTADIGSDEMVVFLIGMRFNQLWRVWRWLPTFNAMPPMLRHLEQTPESGLLGWHVWFGRTVLVLTYWRSAEQLIAFAGNQDAPHAPAWRAFNRRIGDDGSVGIWHETYVVGPGKAEAVYVNMLTFGLAAATSPVPVTPERNTARRRLAVAPDNGS
ncbi:transcriptional regulator [Longimycelium tulufanense]|uniref:Transcriptional regulator n=1 Tax=Longimycelium tulufanense TaxID=907463 RepID=A0A8J3FWH0_9PSEU|nr:DUF4188 domain-containing protein [Longimycelium tulufanense]GGM59739.1 transcriptional regulator [Longimycelium tulufanense]